MRPTLRSLALLGAVVLAGALSTGCSSVNPSSERLIGAPTYPPTDPRAVEVLRKEPRRPHVRLGEVYLNPSGEPSVAEMEQALREEGAKMGADAVALVYDKTRRVGTLIEGPWWARSRTPVYGRKIVAVAIKFKNE